MPGVAQSKVAVVVVNYNSRALIEANLEPTVPASAEFEISHVVVDNLSTPQARDEITELAERRGWHLILAENRGFGAGANLGVAEALRRGCAAVVLVNPDLRIQPHQVAELAAAAISQPGAIVAPAILDGRGRPWGGLGCIDLRLGGVRTLGDPGDCPRWLSGACLAISAETWASLGGFSEDFFMYWEDVDLSYRCQKAGGLLSLLGSVTVTHDVGGTQGRGKSRLFYYHYCRGRLVFASRQLTGRQQLRWLLRTPFDIRRVATLDGGLSRPQRITKALPPCLLGAAAGALWLISAATAALFGPRR